MPSVNFAGLAGLGTVLLLLAAVARVTYNLYLHPLASFPGPLLHRATRLAFLCRICRGTMSFDVLAFHERYGPVVRIAPDELAFADARAWRDVYGHRTGSAAGSEEMRKLGTFYRVRGVPPGIVAEDRENHAMLRRLMAHGFSDRSMRGQEPIIGGYVDLLVRRIGERAVDADRKDEGTGLLCRRRLDMTAWYNWTTFDIIGDLAFGEPFGSLDRAEAHPWVAALQGTVRTAVVIIVLNYLGMGWLMPLLMKYVLSSRRNHVDRTDEKLKRRMEMDVERPDLIEGLLRKKDEWHLSLERIRANASNLIIAGSETTATLLAGITYLLLANPDCLKRVTEEVRSTFKSDDEITLSSVSDLEYMLACLNEGLRCYPPAPLGLPRVVPRGGATISGVVVPEGTTVAVWHWATYHMAANWTEPFAFRPERFLGDSKYAGDSLDALQPFSVGPRNCIGKNLAYAEMRLILAKLLYNFDMELADKDVNWMDQKAYFLWDKPPLGVYFTPRKV